MKSSLTCVDLFSGCGGLSLGLKSAGFQARLAVEKSDMAAETYYDNFIERITDEAIWRREFLRSGIANQAKSGLVVKELGMLLEAPDVIDMLEVDGIDLVAGGPPCQGFSMAGRRNPEDIRNKLPWQFLEFVEKVQPKAVIIENVSGIRSHFSKHDKKSPFDELGELLSLTGSGYVVQPMLLNALHFGVPQNRLRVFLVAISIEIAQTLGDPTFADGPAVLPLWNSVWDAFGTKDKHLRPFLAPPRTHFPASSNKGSKERTVSVALYGLTGEGSHDADKYRDELLDLEQVLKPRRGDVAANHRFRQHSQLVRERFQFYQFASMQGIPKEILSIPRHATFTAAQVDSAIRARIPSHINFPAKLPDGRTIEDAAAFVATVNHLATKKHSQRALRADAAAPTVVSLPDDFVHPSEFRVPTVRELARFQSFPDAFEFRSKETTGAERRRFEVPQYTQVGNAVPPLLARALGNHLHAILKRDVPKKRGNLHGALDAVT